MSRDTAMPGIVLGLITCRNPAGLEKLLRALDEGDRALLSRIVVVDNDAGRAAMALCAALADEGFHPKPEAFHEAEPGISFARNRVLREARMQPFAFVAMLDDDEYPAPGWLAALHRRAVETGADVTGGPVLPVLEAEPPSPLRPQDYAHRISVNRRGRVMVGATSNLLLSARLVTHFEGAWFSPRYALTGGSDTEFLTRSFDAGFLHAMADDAVAHEDIPAARLTRDWLERRAYRAGNGITRLRIERQGRVATALQEAANALGLLLRMAGDLAGPEPWPRKALLLSLKRARLRGKRDAFRGRLYLEYGRENYR